MEPKRGLFAGGGSTVRLPRQMPYPHAMELLLTADMVDAQGALAMGVVVPAEQLMDTAYEFAERIAANAPLAVFATKQSAVEGLALDLDSAYDNETAHSDRIFATEDAKKGPPALSEKRPPRWQGRLTATGEWRDACRDSTTTAPSSRSTTRSRPRSRSTRSDRSPGPSAWCAR